MKAALILTVICAFNGLAHAATTATAGTNTATATATNPGGAPNAHATGQEAFKLIHAGDLANMMASQKNNLYIFDANNPETRAKQGVIPGAKLLDSSSRYNTAMLPADKMANVVFYCQNTECMASHEAAKRATSAGYKNVSVMADGIDGWQKAGKPTSKPAKG